MRTRMLLSNGCSPSPIGICSSRCSMAASQAQPTSRSFPTSRIVARPGASLRTLLSPGPRDGAGSHEHYSLRSSASHEPPDATRLAFPPPTRPSRHIASIAASATSRSAKGSSCTSTGNRRGARLAAPGSGVQSAGGGSSSTARRIHEETERSSAAARRRISSRRSGANRTGTVATDSSGDVYVADSADDRIEEFSTGRAPSSTSTSLSGGGQSGASISVAENTAVSDTATLSGANASTATGTVTYSVYSDSGCTTAVSTGTAQSITTPGALPASSPVTLSTSGTYYWQASYSGDSANTASTSTCGSEVEIVTIPVVGSQAIAFTSRAPTTAVVGGPSYVVAATGGASGNPVTFSSATSGVCTVSGSTVSFVGAGMCTLDANQAGNSDYAPAPTATQSFAVAAQAAATGNIALDGSTITVQRNHEALIKLTCTGTATCSGRLTLTIKRTTGRGKKRHTKTDTIGTATFSIPAGPSETVKLTLNGTGRALLSAAHGHLSSPLTILKPPPSPRNKQLGA